MTQIGVLLQISQKVRFHSKSYEMKLKFLKPDFHLRLFHVRAKKRYAMDAKHLQLNLNECTTISQSDACLT